MNVFLPVLVLRTCLLGIGATNRFSNDAVAESWLVRGYRDAREGTAPFVPPRQRTTRIGELRPRKSRRGSEGHLALWRTRRMQLPGGSTRIPPARAPASVLDIINGNNIATITGHKRINNKNSRSGGPGYNNHRSKSSKKHDSSGYRSDNESTLSKKARHPETRANGRHLVTEQQLQSLASVPRRKVRGEE